MRKTTILLSEEQYLYLLEKVYELKKKKKGKVSMGSIIRDLIEKDMYRAKRDSR